MACVGVGGSTSIFGSFISEWLPLLVNLWLAWEMLDAQEEAEAKMEEIADESLKYAEELFKAYMELRGFDSAVYGYLNSQPLYTPCNRDRHAIQTLREATSAAKKAMGSTSRYDCGDRLKIANDAVSMALIGTFSERETFDQFEMSIEDSYIENHYDAIVSSVTQTMPTSLSGAFNSSAAIWGAQLEYSNNSLAGSIASIGYYAKRIF